jgi:peptidoglycan glycosyltransferase
VEGRIQEQAVAALGTGPGAVVVIDVESGGILALASAPAYDPNRLEDEWETLLARDQSPLLDRATQGAYQPGTALLPLVMAWAENRDLAGLDDAVTAMRASIGVDGRRLACTQPRLVGGDPTFRAALIRGCPRPFFDLGERMEAGGLTALYADFGLDRPVPLDERRGAEGPGAPAPAVGNPGLAAIGQDILTVSPLQLARAYAAVFRGGGLPVLRLVDAVRTPEGTWDASMPADTGTQVLDPDVAGRVERAMATATLGAYEYVGHAIVGPEAGVLAWAVRLERAERTCLVLVVLETGEIDVAREIADGIVAALRAIR